MSLHAIANFFDKLQQAHQVASLYWQIQNSQPIYITNYGSEQQIMPEAQDNLEEPDHIVVLSSSEKYFHNDDQANADSLSVLFYTVDTSENEKEQDKYSEIAVLCSIEKYQN